MTEKQPLVSVSDLSAGYGEGRMIADVTFSVYPGEILCLVGESGCGKSTLLKSLMGTTPGLETVSGRIVLEGTDLSALSVKERTQMCCDKLGIVSQNPGAAFNPIRSYRKQFIETLKSHGKYGRGTFEDQVRTSFEKMGLTDWQRILTCCPYEMSGGMNQRIALALVLLLDQDMLLADEPTSSLDATIQLQVAKELLRLRDVSGVAQIIVTHNLALAQFLADRIGVMYAGRIVEMGTPDQVLADPQHPYTRALIRAIPTLNGEMPVGLDGTPPLDGPSDKGCEFRDRCPMACSDGCDEMLYSLTDRGDGHLCSCCGKGGDV
ncbi:MAG: ABC transporter ATP-binding protein [Eubacteriaceae bacterium]|nr:ABC transporter ATP-binding protein [Eubacteriaceae bacterium]